MDKGTGNPFIFFEKLNSFWETAFNIMVSGNSTGNPEFSPKKVLIGVWVVSSLSKIENREGYTLRIHEVEKNMHRTFFCKKSPDFFFRGGVTRPAVVGMKFGVVSKPHGISQGRDRDFVLLE